MHFALLAGDELRSLGIEVFDKEKTWRAGGGAGGGGAAPTAAVLLGGYYFAGAGLGQLQALW